MYPLETVQSSGIIKRECTGKSNPNNLWTSNTLQLHFNFWPPDVLLKHWVSLKSHVVKMMIHDDNTMERTRCELDVSADAWLVLFPFFLETCLVFYQQVGATSLHHWKTSVCHCIHNHFSVPWFNGPRDRYRGSCGHWGWGNTVYSVAIFIYRWPWERLKNAENFYLVSCGGCDIIFPKYLLFGVCLSICVCTCLCVFKRIGVELCHELYREQGGIVNTWPWGRNGILSCK